MPEPWTERNTQESGGGVPSIEVAGPSLRPSSFAASLQTPRWVWTWFLVLVLVIFLYLARSVLGPFIIAGVLAYIFSMVIDNVQERFHLPRWLAVSLLYLVVLGALAIGLYFGASALFHQTRDFIARGPNLVETGLRQIIGDSTFDFGGQTWDAHLLADRITSAVSAYLSNGGSGDALHLATMIGGRLLDMLLVIIVSFYLLLSGNQFGSYLLKFVPSASRERTGYVAGRIHAVLGAYLRGQLLLIGLMALVSFLVLQFGFGLPYALPLAILTGFLEIIPLVGPAVAATLAAVVAMAANGPGAAIGVVIAYLVLREIEDNLVMPIVVGRVVEIHPVVTIFAVLAGGAAAGVLGMLLAVPTAAAIKVLLDFLYPDDPDLAMVQAQSGLDTAEREAEARDEEPATLASSE